jgi:hypothetical protein
MAVVTDNFNVFVQVNKLAPNDSVGRSLKAYLLLLLGFVLFNNVHGGIVDDHVPVFSWGSMMVAATYRSLCKASARMGLNSNLTMCPLLSRVSTSADPKWTTLGTRSCMVMVGTTHPPWAPLIAIVW